MQSGGSRLRGEDVRLFAQDIIWFKRNLCTTAKQKTGREYSMVRAS